MNFLKNSTLVLAFLPLGLLAQKPGDTLFGQAMVHDINITFSQTAYWDSLTKYKQMGDSLGKDVYMMASVTIDGTTIDSIGVRLKGNSTYQHPGQKKPIRLDFNRYVDGKKYDGLKGIHLNNGAYDPTMLREKLFLDMLNKYKLAAPRCTYTRVSFNGQYVGLYKIVEHIDKTFLKTHFSNNDRNLYKGDPFGTLQWKGNGQSAYYSDYELKTNETQNDWSDLVNFINLVNNSGSAFPSNIAQAFNTDVYLKTWAANNLFVNLDTYIYNAHNYYLFNDSIAGKFQWISWDVGVVFGVFPLWWQSKTESFDILYLPNPATKLPLNMHLLEHEPFKEQYLEAMCTYLYNDMLPAKIYPKIDSLAAVVRPHIYAEPDANQMYTEAQFEGNLGYANVKAWLFSDIPGLKDFIAARWTNVSNQLCAQQWSCSLGSSFAGVADQVISIYPNPSNDKVTVHFKAPQYNVSVRYRITDIVGNKVFDEEVLLGDGEFKRQLDVSCLAAGMYVLAVDAGCQEVKKKLIIAR